VCAHRDVWAASSVRPKPLSPMGSPAPTSEPAVGPAIGLRARPPVPLEHAKPLFLLPVQHPLAGRRCTHWLQCHALRSVCRWPQSGRRREGGMPCAVAHEGALAHARLRNAAGLQRCSRPACLPAQAQEGRRCDSPSMGSNQSHRLGLVHSRQLLCARRSSYDLLGINIESDENVLKVMKIVNFEAPRRAGGNSSSAREHLRCCVLNGGSKPCIASLLGHGERLAGRWPRARSATGVPVGMLRTNVRLPLSAFL
jgi:hypothetical protein